MNVRALFGYWLYGSRDHRGRVFDVRRTTGSAARSMTVRLGLRVGAWSVVAALAATLLVHAWRFAARAGTASEDHRLWAVSGVVLVSWAFSAMGMATELPRERRRRCEALAARGRCGACGYDLAKVKTEPDGCRVCPECGTAWRR